MARPLRIEYEGPVYHVTSRGNARADIYLSDSDREMFLDGSLPDPLPLCRPFALIRMVEVAEVSWIRQPDAGESVSAKVRYQMLPAMSCWAEVLSAGPFKLPVSLRPVVR